MNFLDHYLNYSAVNESPESYHLWSGFSLISSIVGRRVWTDMRLFKVYPNLYVVLAGPPGATKTTAMNVAKDFMKTNLKKVALAPAAITKEALVQTMAKLDGPCIIPYQYNGTVQRFSQISVFANELISLLTCGGNPTGMIDFMTDVFDQEDYRETTKNKGDNEILAPFFSMLACCTTETLKQLVNQKVVSGGMSRRCVFVVEKRNKKSIPFLDYTQEQLDSKEYCAQNWQKFQNLVGPFHWTSEAKEFYTSWYHDNTKRKANCSSTVLEHFLQTKPVYCIKLSMLLALASEHPALTHSLHTFRRATEIISSVEDGAARLFDAEGRNELASIAQDVELWLQDKPRTPILYKAIYNEFWKHCKDTQEIDRILEHLERTGKLDITSRYADSVSVRFVTWKSPS